MEIKEERFERVMKISLLNDEKKTIDYVYVGLVKRLVKAGILKEKYMTMNNESNLIILDISFPTRLQVNSNYVNYENVMKELKSYWGLEQKKGEM